MELFLSSDENKLFGGRIGKPKVAFALNVEKCLFILKIWID